MTSFRWQLPIAIVICLLWSATDASAGWPWNYGGKKVRGSGEIVTETRDIGKFQRIKIDAAFDVEIIIGKKQSLKLTFDDNLIELISTETTGKTLCLDTYGRFRSKETCLVEITVPGLERISTNGAADITIHGFDGGFFEYNLSGAGNFYAEGNLDEIEINISGAGDVDCEKLSAEEADVMISGTGNVKIFASQHFRGRVSGVGNIRYYGNPEDVSKHVSGLGRIRKR